MDFTGERFVPHIEGDIQLEHMHRYLAARRLVHKKRVLDIACGEGYGSDLLAEAAETVLGVDIDEASIKHAQQAYVRPNVRFLRGDAVAIPLGDACVDVVVSFETIEHLTDHRRMMTEVKRVLVPGGVLVISSPDRREYSDVPRYKNPYHRRELYLSELHALLEEHFSDHAIYGQRVHYASVIAPTEGRATTFIGYRSDESGDIVEGTGLPNPVYFIALASDGPLPELPTGLFIPQQPPYMRDITFLSSELELQQRLVAEVKTQESALSSELGERSKRVDELSSALDLRDRNIDELTAQLEARRVETGRLRRQAVALELSRATIHGELDQRGKRVSELEAQLRDAADAVDALRDYSQGVEQSHTELIRRIGALHASRSWRAMAPLRGIGIGLRKLKRAGYLSAAVASRLLYRAVPLPISLKMRVKHRLFSRMGSTFSASGAYARWQESNAMRVSLQDIAPSVELALLPISSPPQPPWTAEALPIADGNWEWQSYAGIRTRITEVFTQRRTALPYRSRQMIELGDENATLAASRISLRSAGVTPDVSIIIPVFNELVTTIECLLSISATEGDTTFEVIVANDASTDRTREVLSQIPNLRLINQPENLGFLRNCNTAVLEARGRRLVFLNNDTQVTPNWLTGLAKALDEPGVGAVGPRIVYPSGALQEAGVYIRREGAVEMIGLNDLPESPRWSYKRHVDYVSGACLMIDTALFRELGGFADDLAPAYCEDLDLCLRVRERGLAILYTPEAEIVHHLSKSSGAIGDSYKQGLIARNMQRLSERHQSAFDSLDDLRIIAFYLPQFHPIPENDLWWGPGFTEWTNVGKARPNFVGHDQPRLPSDLGYYDLRLSQAMEAQWDLANRYGVDGFCYYYYWFDGHRLLDQPLDRLLNPAAPAHPFCLCWANENWTRRWDGQENEVLMAQRHSPEDDLKVIRDLALYMHHPAYIQIRGRPVLLIYRTDLFPDFGETARRWREEYRRLHQKEIYLILVESFGFAGASVSPSYFGCDASVEFPAHYMPVVKPPTGTILNPHFHGKVASYDEAAVRCATREHPGFTRFRTVLPGWDNTARRQNDGFIIENPTPGSFQAWLEAAIAETKRDLQGEERLLFVNAWNEWAEGAYLEPDRRFGHTFLEAVRNARDAAHLLRGAEV